MDKWAKLKAYMQELYTQILGGYEANRGKSYERVFEGRMEILEVLAEYMRCLEQEERRA
ncbi:MAG: hypothetical protein DDT19_01718 [Syntrophomonadaceae bacterium]|nr:hypothetical protein [Bacillota bacterium]